MSGQSTRGVVFVHSSPRALCPHVEWATGSVLNARVAFEWTPQPAAPEMFRAELSWTGVPGTGARLASALRGWNHLRYEVTEEASRGVDGGRWSHTPELGIFHAQIDTHGNVMVPEDRVRAAMEHAGEPASWPSVRPGTTSWSRSVTPVPVPPCAGCTGWADRPEQAVAEDYSAARQEGPRR